MKRMLVIILLVLVLAAGCAPVQQQEQGMVSVYFCPQDDCEAVFVDFIDSAEDSLYCALYDVTLDSVISKLREKTSEVDVKLVVDDRNYGDVIGLGIAKADNSSALMHNKFCIVDNKKVLTGSYNPTSHKNHDNIVIINSQLAAAAYLSEFGELWNGMFGDGELSVGFAGTVQPWFCPEDNCADKLKQQIIGAQDSIYFMTFSFTDNDVANELIIRHMDGVAVNGMFENSQISQYSVYDLLKFQEFNVTLFNGSGFLHHKVFIIDGKTVITGSYNPTKSGNTRNDENMLIIYDENMAQLFLDEFGKVAKT